MPRIERKTAYVYVPHAVYVALPNSKARNSLRRKLKDIGKVIDGYEDCECYAVLLRGEMTYTRLLATFTRNPGIVVRFDPRRADLGHTTTALGHSKMKWDKATLDRLDRTMLLHCVFGDMYSYVAPSIQRIAEEVLADAGLPCPSDWWEYPELAKIVHESDTFDTQLRVFLADNYASHPELFERYRSYTGQWDNGPNGGKIRLPSVV